MTAEMIRDMLAWSAVINYAFLFVWFLLFTRAHDWMYGVHGHWFKLSVERFDAIHYGGMAMLKIGILMFALGPYLALRIVM
jgi:hypothetical protein